MGLHPDQVKSVVARFHDHLAAHREGINGLNVYPVPDGDTGTNMLLTVQAALAEVEAAASMAEVAGGLSHGSLMGARGNSGVILAQFLIGFADTIRSFEAVEAAVLAEGLRRGSEAARRAVQNPVEGTILTVMRAAAEAGGDDLAALAADAHRRAVEVLEQTPSMLPVLDRAGVVDAGGAGFVLLLAALSEVTGGEAVPIPAHLLLRPARLEALEPDDLPPVADLRYEVMFLLDADDEGVGRLRAAWEVLGDSIVVVGGGGTWSCHIHTDDVGPAIEAGVAAGRPSRIRVSDLRERAAGSHRSYLVPFEPTARARTAEVGVVAVLAGEGLVRIFQELDVQGVVSGGQSMNPSTEEILAVVDSVPSGRVIVLPNNPNVIPVAEQVDSLTSKEVEVVPTRNVQQGVGAMLGYSPGDGNLHRTAEDMAAAASAIVTGEVVRAVRDASVEFGRVRRGDWLGVADGQVLVADADLEVVLRGLVAAILPPFGAEMVTVYTGLGAEVPATKSLEAWLAEVHPGVVLQEVEGGQPVYPYLVAVE